MSAPSATARKPRGRPRAFTLEHEAIFRNMLPEITTGRGLQNKMYAMRAFSILKESAGADVTSRFEWLVGASLQNPKFRYTVLAELGRIENPADVITMAQAACDARHSPRKTVALLRQRLRKKGKTQPTADDAANYLAGAVDRWFEQYPDADRRVMLDALNEVYSIIQERTEGATSS